MDPVNVLPVEMIEEVLAYLDLSDLESCSLVSKSWNNATNNDAIWRELCLRKQWSDCGALNKYVNSFEFLKVDEGHSFHSMCRWKQHYVLRNQIRNNWRKRKLKNVTFEPLECMETARITSNFCDGHNLVFGFDTGLVKIYDLEDEKEDCITIKCALDDVKVDKVKMSGSYVVVVQANYLLVYKFNEDRTGLQLHAAKLFDWSGITNVDITVFMDSKQPPEVRAEFIDFNLFDMNDKYLLLVSSVVTIDVYKWDSGLEEPITKITWDLITLDSVILSLRIVDNVLYYLVGGKINEYVEGTIKLFMHAYSLDCATSLYVCRPVGCDTYEKYFRQYTLEVNEFYILLLKYNDDWAIVVMRQTGAFLMHKKFRIFLNANSDPRLVGTMSGKCFKIMNPEVGSITVCNTLMGIPIAMHSDIVVTCCFEYDRFGTCKPEIEFWDSLNPQIEGFGYSEQLFWRAKIRKCGSLKLRNVPNVVLLYGDYTKLVFYCQQDNCTVQSYIA